MLISLLVSTVEALRKCVSLEHPNYIFDELFLLFSSLLLRLGQGNCRQEPNVSLEIVREA